MKIYDISKPIDSRTKRFNSEPITRIRGIHTISSQCNVSLSEITISSHAGTHCDAPAHYLRDANTIDTLELSSFIGKCLLIDISHIESSIKYTDINHIPLQERILFKVRETKKDFAYFSQCCIEYLGSKGVKLIGTNAISIDEYSAKILTAHLTCLQYDIQIIEGLYLNDVESGEYIFIGLPLKLVGADASPVRAILVQGGCNVS